LNPAFIIIGRILASPLVNVFQKKLTNKGIYPELIVMLSYLFFVVISIPLFIILKPFSFSAEFWWYICLLGVFDIFGNMFLVKSLKSIDLSVFGPLNSFKPVFALIFSAVLLSEMPSLTGLTGVIVIIFGSYLLGYQLNIKKTPLGFAINRGLVYRFLAILLTSVAAVFSKKTILLSSPVITLMYWSVIGFPFSLLFYLRSVRKYGYSKYKLRESKWHLLGLFVSFLALQLLTLLTFKVVFVGYSLAFFQLSGLVSVFFGFHFFKETNLKFRILGAAVMSLGAIMIALFG
jgi:drug/metabolite transporter (DMT)-like permease